MSKTLYLKAPIEAICAAAGFEVKSVREIAILPGSVTFELYDHEMARGLGAPEVTVLVTFPTKFQEPE